jgi:hypothetical protein
MRVSEGTPGLGHARVHSDHDPLAGAAEVLDKLRAFMSQVVLGIKPGSLDLEVQAREQRILVKPQVKVFRVDLRRKGKHPRRPQHGSQT